jgi:hypothetical protein
MMQRSQNDEYDRRSRLVSLAYEVLQDLKIPTAATDEAMLSLLSRAFLAKATALVALGPPKERGDKPVSMFSTQAVKMLVRRHVH